jgi:large subunit ribosomal protein L6
MSRIGRKPVPLPKGVTAQIDVGPSGQVERRGPRVTVKGPKGEISRTLHPDMLITLDADTVVVKRPSDESRHKALHGLTRTLVANMVEGVTSGFAKSLEIQGVGYKAEPKPFGVQLVVGFSHPVPYHAPKGIKITVTNNVLVKVEGIDKELVGQVAAELRNVRPPEPYKGKGIRYVGEQVRRKAGKTAQAAK